MAAIAFVGFGELGASLAEGLSKSHGHVLRAFLRGQTDTGALTEQRLAASGTERCASLAAAVAGADAVFATVPGRAARGVAVESAAHVQRGSLYVDFSSGAPEEKRQAELSLAGAGAPYADAAVLGSVAVSGFAVPILASGPGARPLQALVEPDGMQVKAIDAPAGHASLVKLLRSIYLKGRDALIVEMMLTARRYGLDDVVAASIRGPGEQLEFTALAERVLRSVALHAERRADELAMAADVAGDVGIDSSLARSGSQTLRDVASLGLRERFGHGQPRELDAAAVLAAIDELSGTTSREPEDAPAVEPRPESHARGRPPNSGGGAPGNRSPR